MVDAWIPISFQKGLVPRGHCSDERLINSLPTTYRICGIHIQTFLVTSHHRLYETKVHSLLASFA